MIRLAVPVFNRQGARRGLVVVNILAQALLHRPKSVAPEQGGFVFVTDQRGYYLRHSAAAEKEWGGPADLNTGHSLWADFPQAAESILSGQTGSIYTGETEIIYAPIQIDARQGAFLVLGQAVPTSAYRPARVQFAGFFGILLLSLALAAGLGIFLARRITAPLELLRQSARQVAAGSFDRRVQAAGSPEIAELAADFNRMADQLAELYGGLQADYQRLFESASDSIFIHDLNNRFLAVNENAVRRLGYTRDELLQMPVQDLDTPEAAARIEANKRLLGERGSLIIESAHRRKDGSAMPVEISATLTEYRGQRAVMSFARDISERKRGEAAVQQALAEAQQRQAEVAALLEAARAVLTYQDFVDAAQAIFAACKRLTGATAGYVALLRPQDGEADVLFLDPGGQVCTADRSRPMPLRGVRELVYRTRQVAYRNDFAASEGAQYVPDGHMALANILFAPLILEGEAVGLLGMANKPGGFSDHDAELAQAFSDLAALALRNSQTLASLRRSQAELGQRNAELTAQNSIAHTISQSLDLQTVLDAALAEVLEALEVEAGGVYLIDPDRQAMTLWVLQGMPKDEAAPARRLGLGEGIAGQAVASGKPIVLDIASYPTERLTPLAHKLGIQTLAAAPLVAKGRVLGALSLAATRQRSFTPEKLDLLTAIGQQIGVAIENAQLYEQLRTQRIEEQTALLRLSQELLASLDPQEILQRAVSTAADVLRADGCDLMLLEADEQTLTLAHSRGREQLVGRLQVPNTDQSFPGYIVRQKTPLSIPHVTQETRFLIPTAIQEEGVASALGAAVLSGEEAIGALIVDTRDPRQFSPEEGRFLSLIANQTGLAIQRAGLFADLTDRSRRLRRLYDLAITMTGDVTSVADQVVSAIAELLGVRTAIVERLAGATIRVIAFYDHGQLLHDVEFPLADTPCERVQQEKQVCIYEQAAARFPRDRFLQERGIVAYIGLPIVNAQGEVIAVMNAMDDRAREFSAEDLELLHTLARRVGWELEHTEAEAEIRRRAGQLALLNRTGLALNSDLSLERVLQTVVESACELVNAGVGIIYLFDRQAQTFTVSGLHYAAEYPHRCDVDSIPGGFRVTGGSYTDLLEGKTIRLADIAGHPKFQGFLPGHLPLRGLLGVPIFDRSRQVIGFFMASDKLVGETFSAEDEELLIFLASQASLAIENAHAYATVEERARALSQEVSQHSQRAETVLRSIWDGVYTVDCDLHVLSWSQGAEAITGYTAAEVLGRPCADFLRHQDEHGEVLCGTDHCPFTRVWSSGKAVGPDPVFAHHKDGRLLPVSVTAAPIVDEEGFVASAVEVFRDVTRERELVENLRAASRAKTRFLANMSHELRTPLNGILGISQALLHGVYGELTVKQAARLTNVHDSGQHLLQLINDLLDLARIEEDCLTLTVQPISVADLCRSTAQMIQPAADARRISMEVKIEPESAIIQGDERRLRQILLNLLSNAVKFTPEHGRIGLSAARKAGGIQFIVWDTGIGIARERQALLFQPFSQVDDDLARRYQGTGLGLALVKRLAELHAGWAAVESEPGRGSSFYVWIPERPPASAPSAAPADVTARAPAPAAAPAAATPSRRVLVVDDNPQIAQLVQDILEDAGYEVLIANDGSEGLAIAHREALDLILMDLQMPGLNGVEVTRRLKTDPATRAIPIIALTAQAMPEEREQALAAGLDDYLTKPIELRVLVDAVERWTRGA
jgi:PAS domain S-box-containing protein